MRQPRGWVRFPAGPPREPTSILGALEDGGSIRGHQLLSSSTGLAAQSCLHPSAPCRSHPEGSGCLRTAGVGVLGQGQLLAWHRGGIRPGAGVAAAANQGCSVLAAETLRCRPGGHGLPAAPWAQMAKGRSEEEPEHELGGAGTRRRGERRRPGCSTRLQLLACRQRAFPVLELSSNL